MTPRTPSDPHDLARFVAAQATCYTQALQELEAGRKRSHWMWFVFPQVAGLGSSSTSHRYAIGSRAEAEAYLAHDVLGPRLRTCADALLRHTGRSVRSIFGWPDDRKLCSSMTLFAALDPAAPFERVLQQFFAGRRCEHTLRFLA